MYFVLMHVSNTLVHKLHFIMVPYLWSMYDAYMYS